MGRSRTPIKRDNVQLSVIPIAILITTFFIPILIPSPPPPLILRYLTLLNCPTSAMTYSDVACLGAQMPVALNSTFNSILNATFGDSIETIELPLFGATWNPFLLIFHLLNHPKIKVSLPRLSLFISPIKSVVKLNAN